MILDEFDENSAAIIEPRDMIAPVENFPEIVLACFSGQVMNDFLSQHSSEIIAELVNINGSTPVFEILFNNLRVALTIAPLGSASCVDHLEEVVALGAKKVIIFGTCGVLDNAIKHSQFVIPTSAVRDEGTSYHYMPVSDEVFLPALYRDKLESILTTAKVPYQIGKTWTTDAFYRETKAKLARRKAQGCQFVDMECSAVLAWAQFRDIEIYPFFYTADDLDQAEWNRRIEYRDNLDNSLAVAFMIAAGI